jgi:DNA-binding transcriptional ArsR family regulator
MLAGGEKCVGELAREVGLDQSPLSQHLAKLREDGLVATRRDAQTIYYRIAKPEVLRVLKLLKEIYCS